MARPAQRAGIDQSVTQKGTSIRRQQGRFLACRQLRVVGLKDSQVNIALLDANLDQAALGQFAKQPNLEMARQAIIDAPGIQLKDDREASVYPTTLDTTNGDDCFVGRIREDIALERSLSFWVVGDQVRKGAALNAVQIAELLIAS